MHESVGLHRSRRIRRCRRMKKKIKYLWPTTCSGDEKRRNDFSSNLSWLLKTIIKTFDAHQAAMSWRGKLANWRLNIPGHLLSVTGQRILRAHENVRLMIAIILWLCFTFSTPDGLRATIILLFDGLGREKKNVVNNVEWICNCGAVSRCDK